MERSAPPPEHDDLSQEIRALRREIERLNDHRFVRVQNSTPRMLASMFARGLALGLGTVIGASVLVSVLAFALTQIDFVPILGDWASEFARQIEAEVAAERADEIVPEPEPGSGD